MERISLYVVVVCSILSIYSAIQQDNLSAIIGWGTVLLLCGSVALADARIKQLEKELKDYGRHY